MSQAEDKMINELVTELLDEVKTSENKEPTPERAEQKQSESSSGTTPSIPTESSGSAMPQIDLSQANKLFSGLIKSFIPPELKKNKDVQKMFDMFFADTNSKKETKPTVNEEKKDLQEDVQDDDIDVDNGDGDGDDDDDEDEEEDVDEEEDGENEEEVEDEEDVEDEQDNVEDCECDCNNCEIDCDSCVYESVKYAFVIMWDDKPIAFTKTFTSAQKYMNKLYRNLVMKHANVFTKTVRELGSIRVFERKVYTLFPFQDTLMAHFSIKQIPNVE
jgi:hypothetical protein